jgi:biotin operon repressor
METLFTTGRKRETYDVEFAYSKLWECALGIAAVTNSRLLDTLEKPLSYWEELKENFSDNLLFHLDYVETNNTWKALLQLLHQYNGNELEGFFFNMKTMQEAEFKFSCLPFVGDKYQKLRKDAAHGEEGAILEMKEITKDIPFFPQYIEFICKADTAELKTHLIEVMTGWYEAVIKPGSGETLQVLKTDYDSKKKMKEKMEPEELVQWATGGVHYQPEPSVHRVLLIPQYIYRPWTIEADLEGTKVFYYPVANESLSPNDKYMPSDFLVQKHKALGDEIRLRIVKLLSEEDRSLQDITEQLQMGKSTIHHHLKLLRAAKIVEMNGMKYSLKAGVIDLLFNELNQYLKRD